MANAGTEDVQRLEKRQPSKGARQRKVRLKDTTAGTDDAEAGISKDEKREIVERITRSPALSGSPALQAFLRFVTRHAIAGTTESIKEQQIGSEVLGRKPDYDPAEDNIVRVRAHELRQRLAKYFETAGAAERVVVTIPRGSYVPVFRVRTPDPEPNLPSSEPPVDHSTFFPKAAGSWVSRWGGWIAAALLANLLLAELLTKPGMRMTAQSNLTAQSGGVDDFWSQLIPARGPELLVVAADSTFALWQDMTSSDFNLGEYLGRKQFVLSSGDQKLRELAARRLTSTADLNLTVRLTELGTNLGGRVRAQYARNLNLRELQTNNAVLLGSRRSNPWVELFEPRLNFVLARDAATGAPVFVNRKARPGESATFAIPNMLDADGTEQREMNSYAHVALISNLSSSGYVLILEGLNMEGTEAAGEFVANTKELTALLHALDHQTGTPVQPFEALLGLTSVPGGFANTKVIAYRSARR